MNSDIQDIYEKIVTLCSTEDRCYRKCMEEYRSYIEKNFNVQWVLEFPDYSYASRPVIQSDLDIINSHDTK